jgi:hypothetical protein
MRVIQTDSGLMAAPEPYAPELLMPALLVAANNVYNKTNYSKTFSTRNSNGKCSRYFANKTKRNRKKSKAARKNRKK